MVRQKRISEVRARRGSHTVRDVRRSLLEGGSLSEDGHPSIDTTMSMKSTTSLPDSDDGFGEGDTADLARVLKDMDLLKIAEAIVCECDMGCVRR